MNNRKLASQVLRSLHELEKLKKNEKNTCTVIFNRTPSEPFEVDVYSYLFECRFLFATTGDSIELEKGSYTFSVTDYKNEYKNFKDWTHEFIIGEADIGTTKEVDIILVER